MFKGFYLSLFIGPVVPEPAPQVVLDALKSVEVKSSAGEASGFQLDFTLSNRSPLHTIFLTAGGKTPLLRVIILVTINGMPQVLMDGVMTNCQVTTGNAGHSILSVTGEDLTKVMDLIDFSGIPYPAMPVEARVAAIIAKYAMFGMRPQVIPSLFSDIPIPAECIPMHKKTDLKYVQFLAKEAGYVFYIEPGPKPGTNVAYWGPEIKIGVPQPALNLDMDAHTNVDSLNFSFNTAETSLPVVYIQNKLTKAPIPIPIPAAANPLQPPLGEIPAPITGVTKLKDTAKLSPMQALNRGLSEASRSADAISARGNLNAARYGRLLKSRQLVGVRGAGMAFNGLYYVKSVTTSIKRGEIKQSFELTRNGLGSNTLRVPV